MTSITLTPWQMTRTNGRQDETSEHIRAADATSH